MTPSFVTTVDIDDEGLGDVGDSESVDWKLNWEEMSREGLKYYQPYCFYNYQSVNQNNKA